jgi:4-hydroxybenzoate polyprenyltransferase
MQIQTPNQPAAVARNLLRLARPRLLPFVLLLPLVGFGWAHWDHAIAMRGGTGLLWVLAAWTLLQAGTLWLNAALDRDQGEVLLGSAVAVPSAAVPCGYLALAAGGTLGFLGSTVAGVAGVGCTLLATLYSHPKTIWKGHAVLGPFVNGIGYGLLSTLAGWSVVAVAPDLRSVLVWVLSASAILGCYFAAQAFQGDEDKARGYRTLVVTHGPKAVLLAARVCIGVGLLGGTVLAAVGFLPRLCLVALPLGWWIDSWLRRWSAQPDGGDEGWARGLAWRLLFAGLVCVGLAYVDYGLALLWEEPAAGLGTAAGHPGD